MSEDGFRPYSFDLHSVEEEDHWISVSDLMAGLMIVFLFISVALMRNALLEKDRAVAEKEKVEEIAVAYQENQVAIYEALMAEFQADLVAWDAEVRREDLSFEFKSPDVLFDAGEISLKPRFTEILDSFFPRYLQVLLGFKDSIAEVRIEGHTSSDWDAALSHDVAYFKNMELSQGRTRSVLEYVHGLDGVKAERDWIKANIAAVGFSSAHTVSLDNGVEDKERSRRVTFRTVTNAEIQIRKILGE